MKLNYKRPEVKKMYVPVSETVRPGIKRDLTLGITKHHTGVIDVPAIDFYYSLNNKIKRDSQLLRKYSEDAYTKHSVYKSSYHMVVDFDGTIYIFIPLDEIAYASGSANYSKIGKEIFKSKAWKKTVDVENCVSEPDYHINHRQQEVNADIDSDLCIQYNLNPRHDLYKHFDIALDKPYCPAYYIKGLNWERHISMANKMYEMKMEGSLKRLDLY